MSTLRNAFTIVRVSALTLSVVLLAISAVSGMLMNYLFAFLLISVACMIVTLIVAVVKKQAHWSLSGVGSVRAYFIKGFLRNAAWITTGVCVHLAVVPIQFSPGEFTEIMLSLWGAVIALCLVAWIPRQRAGKSLDITLGVFLVFLVFQLVTSYTPPRSASTVELSPPFKGVWYVIQGGNSALLNHHHFAGSQKHALDLIVPEDGKRPADQVTDLRQYATFGREMYAPVEGVVIEVQNSLPDQTIGDTDRKNTAGNHLVIRTATNVFLLMAHLQNGSVLVAEGDRVKIGQKIARVGNSGNTSQPHLHIQAMTHADFLSPDSKPVPVSIKTVNERSRFVKRNDVVRGLSG